MLVVHIEAKCLLCTTIREYIHKNTFHRCMHMSSFAIIIRIRDVHVHSCKHIQVQCELHRCIYVKVYEKNTYMPRDEKEARESRKEARKQSHLRKSFSRNVEKFSAESSTIRISRWCSLKIQCTHFLHCEEEEKESMLRRLVDRHEWRRIGKLGFQECNSLVPELQKKKLGPVGMQKEEMQSSASKCFVLAGKIVGWWEKELDWRRSDREKTQTRGYVFWFFYRSLKLELMLKDFRGRWTLGGFCSLFIFIRVSSCWASVSASRMLMR